MKTQTETLAVAMALAVLAATACAPSNNARKPASDGGGAERVLVDERTSSVAGTVVDAATGEPVSGAVVEAPGGASARTDRTGRFLISGLAPGSEGPLTAVHADGRRGEVPLRPLAAGRRLEVVVSVR